MKSKIMLIGILLMTMCVLFIACENGIQDANLVKMDQEMFDKLHPKSNPVKSVSAVLTTNRTSFIYWFDAVENVKGYNVWWQQEGLKTVNSILAKPQNKSVFALADRSALPNNNLDFWSNYIIANQTVGTASVYSVTGERYRIGVSTISTDSALLESDIIWSDFVDY
jgi:hypothetical protein